MCRWLLKNLARCHVEVVAGSHFQLKIIAATLLENSMHFLLVSLHIHTFDCEMHLLLLKILISEGILLGHGLLLEWCLLWKIHLYFVILFLIVCWRVHDFKRLYFLFLLVAVYQLVWVLRVE
jgi:hypothetical protein